MAHPNGAHRLTSDSRARNGGQHWCPPHARLDHHWCGRAALARMQVSCLEWRAALTPATRLAENKGAPSAEWWRWDGGWHRRSAFASVTSGPNGPYRPSSRAQEMRVCPRGQRCRTAESGLARRDAGRARMGHCPISVRATDACASIPASEQSCIASGRRVRGNGGLRVACARNAREGLGSGDGTEEAGEEVVAV